MKIGILIGSLRAASFSRSLAEALVTLPTAKADYAVIPTSDLPFYDADLETEVPPASWTRLRHDIAGLDGVLFVTPEYNRSVPAVLKNAIDVGSRPVGKSAWAGKAGGVVSISMGALGGFGANHHLRQSMVFLDVTMMQQPEAYIGSIATLFDDERRLKEGPQRDFLGTFVARFESFVQSRKVG